MKLLKRKGKLTNPNILEAKGSKKVRWLKFGTVFTKAHEVPKVHKNVLQHSKQMNYLIYQKMRSRGFLPENYSKNDYME